MDAGRAGGAARGRAVVLGGGIAGLLAARTLTDHFDAVLVVERDDLAGVDGPRRGAPQGRQIHALLARGHASLEQRFPGLTAALALAGAPVGDMLADTRLCFGGHRFASGPSGLPMLCVSRPRLEDTIRAWLQASTPVQLVGGRDVGGLVTDRRGDRVVGVRVVSRSDALAEDLAADLVVDATGRGSRLPLCWTRPATRLHRSRGYRSG